MRSRSATASCLAVSAAIYQHHNKRTLSRHPQAAGELYRQATASTRPRRTCRLACCRAGSDAGSPAASASATASAICHRTRQRHDTCAHRWRRQISVMHGLLLCCVLSCGDTCSRLSERESASTSARTAVAVACSRRCCACESKKQQQTTEAFLRIDASMIATRATHGLTNAGPHSSRITRGVRPASVRTASRLLACSSRSCPEYPAISAPSRGVR